MKKGKVFNLIAGIFDIILAPLMFAVIALVFVQPEFVFGFCWVFISKVATLLSVDGDTALLVLLGLFFVAGVLNVVFGSITVAKTGKNPDRYYKRAGSLIAFTVIEAFITAGLTVLFVWFLKIMEALETLGTTLTQEYMMINLIIIVTLLSISALVLVLRLVGVIMVFCGRKKFRAANAQNKVEVKAPIEVKTSVEIKQPVEVKTSTEVKRPVAVEDLLKIKEAPMPAKKVAPAKKVVVKKAAVAKKVAPAKKVKAVKKAAPKK